MRLRPRPTVKETLTSKPDEDVPPGGVELPRKAQKLLGTKMQVNVSSNKDNKQGDFEQRRRVEQKQPGTRFTAQGAPQIPLPSGITDMPSWSNVTASRRSSSDVLPTPSASSAQPGQFSWNGSSTGVQTNQFYPNHQQSIESIKREYYDPSKQPLYVSQQTSASAVRDMALRKGSPKVHEIPTERIPPRSTSKYSNAIANANTGDSSKQPRKLDICSLFPRPGGASGGRLLSPAKYSNSPSAMMESTEFFPRETMHAEIRRQGANGRFETHKSPKMGSMESASTPRVKIFEPDIYDNAKTNKRRPPKGIKNWFDGFDVSSDEEETEPVELPADPLRPAVEGIPSDFSPYVMTASDRVMSNGVQSARPAQNTLHPMDPAKTILRRGMQSRSSESSTVTEDSSGAAGGQKRSGESRLAHSRLDSQSVLSLSSGSEDGRNTFHPERDGRYTLEDESTLGCNLPSPVPHKVASPQSFAHGIGLRISNSTAPTSGSMPIRLRDSTLAPIAVEDWSSPPDAMAASTEKLTSVPNEAGGHESRSRATTRSGQEREGLKSAGGETSSSALSDASRVMAVTEEEMMLLELMRKKRAAMQNNSFREGYRLALKQEDEYLTKRRQSAHKNVSKLLEERANKEGRFSPTSDGRNAQAENMPSKGQPQTNRFSVFKRQNVDKGFKLDRFLAMEEASQGEPPEESPSETDAETQDEPRSERYVAKMARMERFLMMKPSLADAIYDNRPVSGTEIETDTMTATEDEYAPSPMQRLAGIGRDEMRLSPPESDDEDDDLPEDSEIAYEEHHDKVRAFLLSRHASKDASLTALPQMTAHGRADKTGKRMNMHSLSIPEEDPNTPHVPERSPNRTPTNVDLHSGGPSTPIRRMTGSKPVLQPASRFQERSPLAPVPNAAPTELPSAHNGPLSESTGFTSPLSPTFSNLSPIDRAVSEAPASRSPSYASSPRAGGYAKRIGRLPARIDTTTGNKTISRITSMSSMTSAGEDVLAAWAELGGGSDALAARRRGR